MALETTKKIDKGRIMMKVTFTMGIEILNK